MELQEFLVQSPSGVMHAINPKTKKTYCGRPQKTQNIDDKIYDIHEFEDLGWRFLDLLPDEKHEPTCSICKRHYGDPLKEEMSKIIQDVEQTIHEFLTLRLMLRDSKGLGRFVSTIKDFILREMNVGK